MATNHADEEDYIDMEVTSSSTCLLCSSSSTNSSPQSREFEFQMASSMSTEKDTTTSPADELFYKGKLLPLHLPPRLQMVQKLLQTSTSTAATAFEEEEEQCSMMRFITTSSTAPCTNTSTPLDSCNISPSESCRVSCELNPDEYYFEWTTELSSFIDQNHQTKKSWSKKLKLIKDSSIGQKLKASRAYLRSLFNKSACSDESSAKIEKDPKESIIECSNKYSKVSKRPPFGHISKGPYPTIANVIKNIDKDENEDVSHRRSFSRALKRHSPTKCLSTSFGSSSSSSSSSNSSSSSSSSSVSVNTNGFYELQLLKRSSSDTTEIESSIQAAIAHCKKSSQQPFDHSRSPNINEAVLCSLSACKINALSQDQDRPGVCKI